MTEGTIANFFNAIKAGKGNYRAYITSGNLLFSNTGQALTSGDEYFVRFDSVAPIKDKGTTNSYYAAKESLVIKVNNTSVTLITGTNWTFDSNVVIIDISDDNPTYYYGSRSDINSGTKIYLCYTNNNDLTGFRAEVTNYAGYQAYYEAVVVYALVYQGIRRFYFYDNNTIKMEYYNVPFILDARDWDASTTSSGSRRITENNYTQFRINYYNNLADIKIINTIYGDGNLISKELTGSGNKYWIKMLFLTCKYDIDNYNGQLTGTPQKALFLFNIVRSGYSGNYQYEIDWSSQTF